MQKTIKNTISWSGVGLHSGLQCKVMLHPREVGFGIKFKRTDIESGPFINADVKYVSSTLRGTNLKSGEIEVMTIEHLISALAASEIDNVLVELDGCEIPILDGSARDYYNDIKKAGILDQDEKSNLIEIDNVIEYKDDISGAEIIALPYDGFKVEVWLDYPTDMIGNQFASFSSGDDYGFEIAPSRTFVLAEDLKDLADQDLIKGGDVDNAIILMEDDFPEAELEEVLRKLGKENISEKIKDIKKGVNLLFPNEMARHKILDLMGDLRLAGARIKGRIIAKKPGHKINIEFAKILRNEFQKQKKLKGKPKYDPSLPPIYDAEKIKSFLPHRYPFLLVDKIIELSKTQVVGVKNVSINEQLFTGHFPGNPVFPGVLQMEALAQTGGILALSNVEDSGMWDAYFLKMDGVKFKRMVVPGDTMILKMTLLSPIRRGIVHMQGTVYVGDNIVSEGELTAQIAKRPT